MGGHPDYDVEYDDDYEDGDCWYCGGTGFVSDCPQQFACTFPEEGCDYCTRRCPECRPRTPTPQDEELLAVLGDALKAPTPASGADGQGPNAAETADDASGMNPNPIPSTPARAPEALTTSPGGGE